MRRKITGERALLVALAVATVLATMGAPEALARRGRGRGGDDDRGGSGGGGNARVRRELRLFPTAAGAELGLKGKARLESRPDRGREKLTVEVESRIAEAGTVLNVSVVTSTSGGAAIFIRAITLRPNPAKPGEVRAQLEIERGLPAGVTTASVVEVRVTDPGTEELLLTSRPSSR